MVVKYIKWFWALEFHYANFSTCITTVVLTLSYALVLTTLKQKVNVVLWSCLQCVVTVLRLEFIFVFPTPVKSHNFEARRHHNLHQPWSFFWPCMLHETSATFFSKLTKCAVVRLSVFITVASIELVVCKCCQKTVILWRLAIECLWMHVAKWKP